MQATVLIFFDVKGAAEGTKYLVIDESRRTEGDSYEHKRVMVFQDDLEKFMEGLTKAVNAMASEVIPENPEDKHSP